MLTPTSFLAPRDLLSLRTAASYTLNTHTPELALMRAVLEDALLCALNPRPVSCTIRTLRSKTEAHRWIDEDDLDWPFSFVNICHALGIEPGHIRRGVCAMVRLRRKR